VELLEVKFEEVVDEVGHFLLLVLKLLAVDDLFVF